MLRFERLSSELNVLAGEHNAKIGSIYLNQNMKPPKFAFCTNDFPTVIYTDDLRAIAAKLDELNRAGEGK